MSSSAAPSAYRRGRVRLCDPEEEERNSVEEQKHRERETQKKTLMSPCNGCPGKQALVTVISRLMMSAVLFN